MLVLRSMVDVKVTGRSGQAIDLWWPQFTFLDSHVSMLAFLADFEINNYLKSEDLRSSIGAFYGWRFQISRTAGPIALKFGTRLGTG